MYLTVRSRINGRTVILTEQFSWKMSLGKDILKVIAELIFRPSVTSIKSALPGPLNHAANFSPIPSLIDPRDRVGYSQVN